MKSFAIDPNSQQPIFSQICEAIEIAILQQQISEGDYLPSVRELAVQLEVNPNTVAKAFSELQASQLVKSIKGKGMQVLPVDRVRSQNRQDQLIEAKLEELIELSKQFGLSREQVAQRILKGGKHAK